MRIFKILFIITVFCVKNVFAQGVVNVDVNSILKDLESKMSQVKTISTDFIQEKDLALLSQKLVLKGKVYLQKPNLLAWHVSTPLKYSMLMKGSVIRQWDEDSNKVQEFNLSRMPSMQAAVEQMNSWFSGSYISMQKDYIINVLKQNPIVLEFLPKENSLAYSLIEKVTVSFQQDGKYISTILIQEKSADKTLMKFLNTKMNEAISSKSWQIGNNAQ